MSKPIEAGCKAEVIYGLLGEDSPNIGLVVRVLQYSGDQITLGRIWLCEAEYGEKVQERAHVPAGHMHCAQSWLRRLPDDPTPVVAKKVAEDWHDWRGLPITYKRNEP